MIDRIRNINVDLATIVKPGELYCASFSANMDVYSNILLGPNFKLNNSQFYKKITTFSSNKLETKSEQQ
jgi:hypothetical protein